MSVIDIPLSDHGVDKKITSYFDWCDTEQASWYNRRSKFTKAYEEYLMRMLINSTVTDVARKKEVSFDDVGGVLNRQIETKVAITLVPVFFD